MYICVCIYPVCNHKTVHRNTYWNILFQLSIQNNLHNGIPNITLDAFALKYTSLFD